MTKAQRRAAVATEIVRRLRQSRETSGISMNVLAARAGLSQSMVSRLENLQGNPTLDSLLRIADVLDLELGRLITEAEHTAQK